MLTTLLFLAATATAPPLPLDFTTALDHANHDEKSLPADTMKTLLQAQSQALGDSIGACATNEKPKAFTVVLELDATGTPVHHWRQGDSALAICAERQLAQRLHWVPPKAPFYTSFELTWKP